MKTIKFNGCKYLDYSDSYTAKKVEVNIFGDIKVCWDRPVIDETYPNLVQFCTKRGRLNHPSHCLNHTEKMCSDYEDFEHIIEIGS